METRATKENIMKYHNALKELYLILSYTKNISMLNFSVKHNISKNLSTVLQRGGVIKLTKRGRSPQWEWNTIKPTREMAIETLKRMAELNPEKKQSNRGGKREGAGRKTKKIENRYLESYQVPLFFGLIKLNIKANYKSLN